MLIGWLAAAVLTFAASLFFMGRADESKSGADAVGPSTFSRSAIGHAGFAEILRTLGLTVVKSQYDSRQKLGEGGLLVIAEPGGALGEADRVGDLLDAKTVLLVLPKWAGRASQRAPGWLDAVELLPEAVPRGIARDLAPSIDIVRDPPLRSWSRNEIGVVPVIADKPQLIKSSRLRPVVASDSGMLVGELSSGTRRIWVLADPDVMENHGIAEPENAEFSVALIDALRAGDGNVVFDEVVHGLADQSSPLRLLFEFPFVLATIQGAIAVALLLWATMPRFGAPLAPPVALRSGKGSLIETTAKLLDRGRHRAVIIQRYVHAIVQDVARQLHAPPGLTQAELVEWLRRTARSRAVDIDCGALVSKADGLAEHGATGSLAALARDIFRWKREITDEAPGHPRADRGHPERNRAGRGRAG